MDPRDDITRRHFNQRITFAPRGAAEYADIAIDADLAARLTGAPDGATVTFSIDSERDCSIFTVTHPLFAQPAERILARSPNGHLFLTNNDLRLATTGTGLGVRMLAHQVAAARALGIAAITLWAGAGDDAGRPLNGTWTWARCGFDAPLPYPYAQRLKAIGAMRNRITAGVADPGTAARIAWLEAWPVECADAERVQQVMVSEQGRQWWKAWPDGCNMTFALEDGSVSRKVLAAYLQEKDVRITSKKEQQDVSDD